MRSLLHAWVTLVHTWSDRLVWTSANGVSYPQDGSDKIQRAWDNITAMIDFSLVTQHDTTCIDQARLLAVQIRRSSDWQHALPISSCGLRHDNEAIRVAVSLRLGLELCQPHPCPCGAMVEAYTVFHVK